MGEFYEGYFVLPSDAELTTEAIYQPTGETKMIPTKVSVMVDVMDEDGEPTGKQRFSHYEVDHDNMVEIPLYRGGWSASDNNGDTIAVILSTESVLNGLAAQPDNIEVERIYADGEAVEDVPAPQLTAEEIQQARQIGADSAYATEATKKFSNGKDKQGKPDNLNKPTDEEKAAKKAAKNKKLKNKGFQEIPDEINEPEETINFVFQQVEPEYKFGKVNLG